MARTLASGIRAMDLAARIGGDEFAVLDRIRGVLNSAMEGRAWPVTFSIGAVTTDNPPATCDEALKQADHLMYLAKKGGKDAIVHEVIPRPTTTLSGL